LKSDLQVNIKIKGLNTKNGQTVLWPSANTLN
jgi:hypothetical protein